MRISDRAMKNGKPGEKTIVFERAEHDGSWSAIVEMPDGPIVGTGLTILEARLALDLLLQKRERAQR